MLGEPHYKKSLEFTDVEQYRNVTSEESEEHAYDVFSGLLKDKDPEKAELEEFLREFDRDPADRFLKGIYDAAIDFAEKRNYFPLDIV